MEPGPAPIPSQLQICPSRGDGTFADEDCLSAPFAPDRWERVSVPLPPGWKGGDLRLGLRTGFGLADVAGARIRTTAAGVEVWKLLGGNLAAAARVNGGAQTIPDARLLRVLCAGPEPQIILPQVELQDCEEPLTLEIGLCLRTDPLVLHRLFRELAAQLQRVQHAKTDHWSSLQQARSSLVEGWDANADAEVEMAGLRAELTAWQGREQSSGEEIAGLRSEVDDLQAEAAARQETLARLSKALIETHGQAMEFSRLIAESRLGWADTARQLVETRQGWEKNHQELLEANRRLLDTRQSLAAAQRGWDAERRLLAETRRGWEETQRTLAEALRCRDEVSRMLVETGQRLADKDAQLAESLIKGHADHGRLASMRRSLSWKVTLPLRVLERLFAKDTPLIEQNAPPAPVASPLTQAQPAAADVPPPAVFVPDPAAVIPTPAPPLVAAPPASMGEMPVLSVSAPAPLALAPVPSAEVPVPAPLDADLLASAQDAAPDNGGYRFNLDRPTAWNFATHRVEVRGWCLPPEGSDDDPPVVRFRFGTRHTDVVCDAPRPDVQAANGGNPRWLLCGFNGEIDLSPGLSGVVVEAVEPSGRVWPQARYRVRAPYAAWRRGEGPGGGAGGAGAADPAHDYAAWLERFERLSVAERRALRARARGLGYRPLISVVMPVYNPPEAWLVRAIESVRGQLYPFWELCVADDASPGGRVRAVLERYARQDARIKVAYRETNGHISAASNTALGLAGGEYVALLDHDDELPPHALLSVALRLNEQPALQMIYSDEDKIDEEGQRRDPYFKPDWNYDLFLGQNVFSHLGVFRRDLLTRVGGFRLGLEGSQDYDLVLRCLEQVKPEEIGHIPQVLYHWRMTAGSAAVAGDEKPYARNTARRAIAEHLARIGSRATVEQNPWISDYYHVRRPLPTPAPEVAIVIPTRDAVDLLRTCIESVLRHTDYPHYRIVVVDNASREPATFAYFEELTRRLPDRFRVLGYPGEFNFAALNNFAVREAGAPMLCLLNNDVETRQPQWLAELVSQAARPEVGAAGARLLYPDDTLQHAGIVIGLGPDRTAGHMHHRLYRKEFGYFGRAKLVQQMSAVTAACMVLRRETFDAVGGFDETAFPVALNDADLCLRLRDRGYVIVWTPFAELYHHESHSRGVPLRGTPAARRHRLEMERFRQRHWRYVRHDPAYNPNLTLDRPDFSFSTPPRQTVF